MKRILLTSIFCLGLTACESGESSGWPSFSSFNPFSEKDEVTKVAIDDTSESKLVTDANALNTEQSELERLTGIKADPAPFVHPTEPVEIDTPKVVAVSETDNTPIASTDAVIETKETESPVKEADIDLAPTPAPAPKTETIAVAEEIITATGCPQIEIMPATKSITKFEGELSGDLIARASIQDVRGGCEVVTDGMEVDLDILMSGTIGDKGRFEGNKNAEAFITFPYFVSIISPSGEPMNKEIMATAMRFRPGVDFLDHAEKITQFIPMDNVNQSGLYKIVVGYQLSRKQLEYNRITSSKRPNDKRASPDTSSAAKKSVNPLAGE